MAPNALIDLLFIRRFPALYAIMEGLPDTRPTTYDPDRPKFNLDEFSEGQCKVFFRFYKEDIELLANALRIPEEIRLENRCVVNKIDALCILLARLAYPCRLVQLERMFGRPKTTLSMIVKTMVNMIYERFSGKLQDLDQNWISLRRQTYADAVHDKGAPLKNVFAFIDGTVRPMCRPKEGQRVVYNGHKRVHALKFQSIVAPDGMILDMYGPIEGRRHDMALFAASGLGDQFEQGQWTDRDGHPYSLYGDPAYPLKDYLQSPIRNPTTVNEQLFNARMSSVRECVEWGFGKIIQNFAFLDFKKNLKVLLQPVGKLYIVGSFLTNCHTCLYGSQTGEFFGLQPPNIEEYLDFPNN